MNNNRNSAVAFVTLGCAKNEVDTNNMKERVLDAGYSIVDDPECAQAIVVNTCTFIQSATEESLDSIFELAGLPALEKGSAKLIVAGCMPARYGADLEGELTEADAFLPCAEEKNIVELLQTLIGTPSGLCAGEQSDEKGLCHSVSQYVKISDGCDRFCSYCTIPYIRGRYHSFSFEQIRNDVETAKARGAKEIVLIAQDTGRWGNDFDEPKTLAWLMNELAVQHPDTWFRVMYLQPEGITDELLDVIAHNDNICSYLDIPLQHVDPELLCAMNRKGDAKQFAHLVERIKSVIPDITLRTTLIAGFPGETDEQFEALCDFVDEGYFDYVGVFAYSQEDGTRAAELPDQIDEDEKADRAQRLRDLADAVCIPRVAQRCGETMNVLVEGVEEDGQLFGRAMCQAPEVDGVVYIEDAEIGSIVSVSITDTLLYEMEGEQVNE